MALGAELKDFVNAFQAGWRMSNDAIQSKADREDKKLDRTLREKQIELQGRGVDINEAELGLRERSIANEEARTEYMRQGVGAWAPNKTQGEMEEDRWRRGLEAGEEGLDPIDIATRTVLGEAAGESPEGKAAVAWSMKNRADRWGMPIERVALQPKQYSTWNKGEGGNNLPYRYNPGDELYDQTRAIVERVMAGEMPDPTGGATHYYSPAGMPGGREPYWWNDELRKAGGQMVRIGGHRFAGGRAATAIPVDEESI